MGPLRLPFWGRRIHGGVSCLLSGRNLLRTKSLGVSTTQLRMSNDSSGLESNPKVQKLNQIIASDSTDGWEKSWQQEHTPWDLGKPTPIIQHLHRTGALPHGRTLIPGCGSGYDVVAIACPQRFVVGLDISESAIRKAKELSSTSWNANHFTFLKEDFFMWNTTELFDLIFDYTFFCAIEPDMRPAWAERVQRLLKPNGELLTIMFPIGDHAGGPPFKVSVADYEEVLHPLGFRAVSIMDNEMAVGPRKGREKVGRWRRTPRKSLL